MQTLAGRFLLQRAATLLGLVIGCALFGATALAAESGRDDDSAVQAVVQLGESQRHVLVADVLKHRLEVWQRDGERLGRRLSVRMVLGTGGVGKVTEGDRRTPLGAYRVVGVHEGPSLPAMYGPRAWVLDYPNAWDRTLGRTGSGIWLHGTRDGASLRRSSTGCIVLRNDDLEAVHRLLGAERPWVLVIAARAARGADGSNLRTARRLLSTWQRAMLRGPSAALSELYAASPPPAGAPAPVSVGDVTAFELPGRWVVDFTASDGVVAQRRTQHWKQVRGQWKIAAEGVNE